MNELPQFPTENHGIVLANKDMKITLANETFTDITGYSLNECIGKNCNFLQGPETNPIAVNKIRDALSHSKPCRVAILNYRKNGEAFWNYLSIYPLLNRHGIVEAYVGIQMVQPKTYIDHSLGILPWTVQKNNIKPMFHDNVENNMNGHVNIKPKRMNVSFIAQTELPTVHGMFTVTAFQPENSIGINNEITCIHKNISTSNENINVRVHDQCFTSEVLGSLKCDCKQQLEYAMEYIQKNNGLIIYMPQEGRGIGLGPKIKAYSLQERGFDTIDANVMLGFDEEQRNYSVVPSILEYFNIKSIHLMTNNPYKVNKLKEFDINITDRISIEIESNPHSLNYLKTKQKRMGHMFES